MPSARVRRRDSAYSGCLRMAHRGRRAAAQTSQQSSARAPAGSALPRQAPEALPAQGDTVSDLPQSTARDTTTTGMGSAPASARVCTTSQRQGCLACPVLAALHQEPPVQHSHAHGRQQQCHIHTWPCASRLWCCCGRAWSLPLRGCSGQPVCAGGVLRGRDDWPHGGRLLQRPHRGPLHGRRHGRRCPALRTRSVRPPSAAAWYPDTPPSPPPLPPPLCVCMHVSSRACRAQAEAGAGTAWLQSRACSTCTPACLPGLCPRAYSLLPPATCCALACIAGIPTLHILRLKQLKLHIIDAGLGGCPVAVDVYPARTLSLWLRRSLGPEQGALQAKPDQSQLRVPAAVEPIVQEPSQADSRVREHHHSTYNVSTSEEETHSITRVKR